MILDTRFAAAVKCARAQQPLNCGVGVALQIATMLLRSFAGIENIFG
jgi:hypothetical protein